MSGMITARTAAGGTLYAAFRPRSAENAARRGVVAHSAAVARLAPFSTVSAAEAELKRIGGSEPTRADI